MWEFLSYFFYKHALNQIIAKNCWDSHVTYRLPAPMFKQARFQKTVSGFLYLDNLLDKTHINNLIELYWWWNTTVGSNINTPSHYIRKMKLIRFDDEGHWSNAARATSAIPAANTQWCGLFRFPHTGIIKYCPSQSAHLRCWWYNTVTH